jgi:hypothetical protein
VLTDAVSADSQRVLILAPRGRDALVARSILEEAGITCRVCDDLQQMSEQIADGAGIALVTEEALRAADGRRLIEWLDAISRSSC